jgi:hypothetical protein
MESIFEFFAILVSAIILLALTSIFTNSILLFKIHSRLKTHTKLSKVQLDSIKELVQIVEMVDNKIHKSILDLKRQAETDQIKSSIKPNNWDSMKQAFNTQKRAAIDE